MWKDTTSYSRGDKERVPTMFTQDVDGLSVTITCGHIYYKGRWVVHCRQLGIDTVLLDECDSVDEAKGVAISLVQNKAERIYNKAMSLEK